MFKQTTTGKKLSILNSHMVIALFLFKKNPVTCGARTNSRPHPQVISKRNGKYNFLKKLAVSFFPLWVSWQICGYTTCEKTSQHLPHCKKYSFSNTVKTNDGIVGKNPEYKNAAVQIRID